MIHPFGLEQALNSLSLERVFASQMMAQSPRSERSTEAPMDFQFTSRPTVGIVPVWKDPATPLKREWSHASSVTRTEPTEILPSNPLPGHTHAHMQAHTRT
jgi:hypothetical protein